ncbi:hypothetical protein [Clostridium manihotivorum]|uniref:Uncharacterized protein n=1 Tax=Clostridium manihotivorum TaxID=2320868 RepID=A0A410DVS1_9CLOT|nr:hypothetical protein [Clostridium manihotivorum]QAA33373.1 hypothetical protein C1I91_17920 [Clostridium manihotivorum]
MSIEKKKTILKVVGIIIYLFWFIVWSEVGLNHLNLKVIPFILIFFLGNIILGSMNQLIYKAIVKAKE